MIHISNYFMGVKNQQTFLSGANHLVQFGVVRTQFFSARAADTCNYRLHLCNDETQYCTLYAWFSPLPHAFLSIVF